MAEPIAFFLFFSHGLWLISPLTSLENSSFSSCSGQNQTRQDLVCDEETERKAYDLAGYSLALTPPYE